MRGQIGKGAFGQAFLVVHKDSAVQCVAMLHPSVFCLELAFYRHIFAADVMQFYILHLHRAAASQEGSTRWFECGTCNQRLH